MTKVLEDADIRVEIDERSEKIGYKIREAQLEKVPYMLVLGDREQEAATIAVRNRKDGTTQTSDAASFIESIKRQIKERSID